MLCNKLVVLTTTHPQRNFISIHEILQSCLPLVISTWFCCICWLKDAFKFQDTALNMHLEFPYFRVVAEFFFVLSPFVTDLNFLCKIQDIDSNLLDLIKARIFQLMCHILEEVLVLVQDFTDCGVDIQTAFEMVDKVWTIRQGQKNRDE